MLIGVSFGLRVGFTKSPVTSAPRKGERHVSSVRVSLSLAQNAKGTPLCLGQLSHVDTFVDANYEVDEKGWLSALASMHVLDKQDHSSAHSLLCVRDCNAH